eukprot:9844515-Alexandrium_andersonii.AAC.1
MSASLVGSEMCIRDRVAFADRIILNKTDLVSSEAALASPCLHSSGCVVSVSYTHLTLPTICSV